MDYHRQEQQYGQPLPPLVDDRMLYCPRPMMAGISSPYDGFMRPYGGAGCATLPHHIPHHIGGAMPPTPINPYQAMVHGQQVVPPVGYMPPPSSLHAAYAGARQYLNSMMASPPMLVPHSHSSMFPTDSQVVLTPPMRPTPPMVNHMTVAPSATENTPSNDAILSMPPKLIPASVASRNREVNLSLKPPPLKSHPNVSDLSSTLQSPPGPMPRTVHSSSEQVDHVQRNNLLSYATSALQSWNRSSENRCLETPEQTLDLTIRSLLVSKASTANTTTVSTIKTELAEKPSVDNDTMSVDNASHSIVDGATYDADEQKYVCLSCSYSTPRATKIQQHLKAHAGQLICEDCGKAFIQTCDLERHLNAHLHGRARNSGTKFNMADILLPHGSSDSCDDLPGMVHRHGDMDAVSVVQSEHAHDGRSVDSSDWLAKSPLAPHSEHALSTHVSSLPSLQHSNSCTSSDSELAIVNCFSVSQNYHNAPTDQDSLTQNVVPAENEIGCCSDGEAVTVALQSPSEAALMLESYRRHMDSIHASPTAGTVPKVPCASHAAITMDTMGSESAEMRTSPQMAAPSGERTVLDKARNMARLAVETSPQQSTDLANRFPYSGALAQAARDVNERFSVSTGGPQSVVSENEETSERNSNSSNNEAGLNQKRHLDGTEDTNIKQQKTSVTPPHGSVNQQLIDHLLQSDESPSPSQENDANDVLMSPQGALSSLPISGMFSEPPPMFLPDGTGGAATSPLRFPPADIVSSPPPFAAGVSLCCTLCNYTGRSQRSLQKHYKAHSMSYKICRYCGKAFERPSDLLRHEERHQMAIQRNHTPVIMRGGNFSSKKSGSATTGTRTKAKHAKVLHCRRCGFATTEHHILALHNKKQHQPANWFCSVCGQKFISKTSLELHCIVVHPVVAVRIDSYIKNVLTDTKVLSCSVGADNVIQLDDVSMVWFETLKEQEIPMVSSVMDLKDIVQQTDGTVRNHCEFGDVRDADRPIDLSTYADSPDRNDVTSPEMMLGDSVQTTMDVANKSCGSTSQREINDSVLQTPCSAKASPAVGDLSPPACGVSRDIFAKSGSPRKDVVQVASPADSQPTVVSQSSDKTPKGTSKNRESRHARLCRYTCDQCSYQSNILRKMTQHKHAHDGRYICKLCYKAFIKTSDLTRHWMTHKIMLEGELKCDSCDYHSSDGDQLELHMKIHYHQRGMYNMRNSSKHRACTICHEWVYKKAMRRHMLRVHNWPPGGSTASKAGSSKTSLANCSPQASPGKAVMKKSPSSVLTPNARGGASPKTPPGTSKRKQSGYTCPECNVSFSSSRAIIQHLVVAHPSDTAATHSGKKQTAANCSATSVAVCELCNREFADTIRLARHKAWHTRVSHPTRRQCPICHKQFKTVTYLNQHMQLHSNQKPYECDRCGATFGLHQTLLKHEQRNCSPLRRRAHHVAEDIVSAIDGDTTEDVKLNNFAHTNGVGTVDSDYAV